MQPIHYAFKYNLFILIGAILYCLINIKDSEIIDC